MITKLTFIYYTKRGATYTTFSNISRTIGTNGYASFASDASLGTYHHYTVGSLVRCAGWAPFYARRFVTMHTRYRDILELSIKR
jgi:hypothetical protein